jgi:hypothetical protein
MIKSKPCGEYEEQANERRSRAGGQFEDRLGVADEIAEKGGDGHDGIWFGQIG